MAKGGGEELWVRLERGGMEDQDGKGETWGKDRGKGRGEGRAVTRGGLWCL